MKITQSRYIDTMLNTFGMENCNKVSTPAAPNTKLVRSTPETIDEEAASFPYSSAVGALLLVARCSRPDILYAVGQVSQHLKNPRTSCQTHITLPKRDQRPRPDGPTWFR